MHEAVWVRDPELPDSAPYKGFPFPGLDVLKVGTDGLPERDDNDEFIVAEPADTGAKKTPAKKTAAKTEEASK